MPKANIDPTWWWSNKAFPVCFDDDPGEIARREHEDRAHQEALAHLAATWEGFVMELLSWRQTLQEACAAYLRHEVNGRWVEPRSWPDEEWVKKRLSQLAKLEGIDGQLLLEGAREAWAQLGTAQNRVQALTLLEGAVWREAFPEIYYGPQYWRKNKKMREAREKAVSRAHTKALQAVRQAVEALKEYKEAAWEARNLSQRSDDAFQCWAPPRFWESSYNAPLDEIFRAETELSSARKRIERITDPSLLVNKPGQRGRREKSSLNTAALGLIELFRESGANNSPAEDYTIRLLFVAGIISDPDPGHFSGKVSRLRKRSPL